MSGKTAGQPDAVNSSLLGAETAERSAAFAPAQILGRARTEYAAGRLDAVIRLLKPVQEFTAAAEQISGEAFAATRARSAASVWALLARAAARTGQLELSAKAAGQAASLFAALRSNGIQLSGEELSDAGIAFYLARRLDDAAETMRDAIAHGAASAETCLFQGLIEAELGHPENAVDALNQAAAVDGKDLQQRRLETLAAALQGLDRTDEAATTYYELGNLHYHAGRYAEALPALKQTLALSPHHVYALAAKGEVLRLLGDPGAYGEAIAALEEALRLKPDFAWALVVYGETLHMMDRLEEAAAALERAIDLESGTAQWHYRHGEMLRLLNRFEASLISFDRALKLEPNDPVTLARRGESLRGMGRLDEALADLSRALELTPEDTFALASKGATLRELGKLSEAEEVLQRVVQMEPTGYPFAESLLGYVWLDRNRDAEGLTILERVVEQNPDYVWAREGKAYALFRLDQVEKGLAETQKLLDRQPESAFARAIAGVLLFKVEDYAMGMLELERSIKSDPNIDWAQNALAACCIWQWRSEGRTDSEALLEKAVAASRIAMKLTPDDLSLRATLAEALWGLKGDRRAEAETEFRQVLDAAHGKEKLDFYKALDAGGAAFRLASGSTRDASSLLVEAERLTVEALTQTSDRPSFSNAISARFSLALVMLCSERFALALREYESAVTLAHSHEPGVYRGLLGRARTQLAEALVDWPRLKEAAHAHKALRNLQTGYAAQASQTGSSV